MGKGSPFSEFRLEFNQADGMPEGVYASGHRLTGTRAFCRFRKAVVYLSGMVYITLHQETHVRAIKLLVRGKAQWAGKKTDKEMAVERVYFNRDIILLERPPGQLEPGNFLWKANHLYELPWECPLPRSSPNSYEGVGGHVRCVIVLSVPYLLCSFFRYTCRLTFITEKDGHAYGIKRPICVLAPPPLNIDEKLLEPVEHAEVRWRRI